MSFARFEHSTVFPVSVETLWSFHMRPDSLRLLTPPDLGVEIRDADAHVEEGAEVHTTVAHGPLRGDWTALFTGIDVNGGYTDVALDGPLPFWEHRHEFEEVGRGRTRLRDVVWYSLPGLIPHATGTVVVNETLRALFAWRHARTLELLVRSTSGRSRRAEHASRALVRPLPSER